jgi:hypothetical protein
MADAGQGRGSGKKRGAKKRSGARATGRARLQKAAQKEMGKNSGKLAKVLVDKALAGDLNSAKMLLMLTDPKTDAEGPRETETLGPSVAEQLAKEKEWEDVPLEERRRVLIELGQWGPELEEGEAGTRDVGT